jgi:hypothetical protein
MQAIATNINNQDALKTLFVTANLLCKIFYSLNAVDLPEYFEDNMASFMDAFRKFLHFQTTFSVLLEGGVCFFLSSDLSLCTFGKGNGHARLLLHLL